MNKIKKYKIFTLISIVLILLGLACGKGKDNDKTVNTGTTDPENNETQETVNKYADYIVAANDTTTLNNLVSSLELFQSEDLTSGESEEDNAAPASMQLRMAQEDEYYADAAISDSSVISAKLPAAWYRHRNAVDKDKIEISIDPQDSTATVKIERDIDADLIIDTTFDHIRNPGSKPILDKHTHYAKFKKMENGNWNLTHVSLWNKSLQDTENQKVFIKNVKVYKYDSLRTDSTLVWNADSSSQLFAKDEMPEFHPGEHIRVEAEIENISNSNYIPQNFVFLHHSVVKRDLMENADIYDTVYPYTGTRIYTKEYTIGESLGLYFAAVDVLNSECLQDQSYDNYNSMSWGIPYRVVRRNITQDSTDIMTLIGDSEHFHPRAGINDNNLPILGLQSPIWWRKYKETSANINIVIDKKIDSTVQATATADVTWNLDGELIVFTKGNSTQKNPNHWTKTKKEISEEAFRRAEFIKINNIWRMVKFSPMEIGLRDINKKSLVIQKISVLRNYDTIWKIASPDQLLTRDSTLKLVKGEKVKIIIEAQNENSNSILVYLHYGPGLRRLLFNNEGNGVYGLSVDVDTIPGLHSLIFDVIESNSINDKNAPYNAAMWKMPLLVTIK